MQRALTLLEDKDVGTATAHLQMAIDVVGNSAAMQQDDALPKENFDARQMAADPVLMRATGGALAAFAVLMADKKIATLTELANFLGTYATVTAETSQKEGSILGYWSGLLHDLAQR